MAHVRTIIVARLMLASVFALAVAACGGTGSAPPTATPKASPTATPKASPTATPIPVGSLNATLVSDPHVSGSTTAGYTIIGNGLYLLTVTALDANNNPITVNPPTYTVKSANAAIAVTSVSANTFDIAAKTVSATPVQITVTPSRGNALNFTVAMQQELYVSNFKNGAGTSVLAFNPATGAQISSDTLTFAQSQISAPTALAFDANANLWVANSGGDGIITAYAPGSLTPIAADTNNNSALVSVFGLAFDTHGTLWASSNFFATISAFTPGSSSPIAADTITFGTNTSPAGIAFDASGNLWVASGNNTVSAYVPGTTSPIGGDTISANVSDPIALAFDAQGNLWVANFNPAMITAYAHGTLAQISADTITSGVNQPTGIAFDSSGNLWVVNSGNNTVEAFVPGTNTPTRTITTGLTGPFGLAFAP